MPYEQKPNTGSLFKAKDRATDKHPEYTGSFNIDGTEYWLAAWVKESQNGTKYFSLSVKPKEAKPAAPPEPQKDKARHFDDMKDDIPFS